MKRPALYLLMYDLHYPKYHAPTVGAAMAFLKENPVDGFIFGGDQLDLECISHHTKGRPLYRTRKAYTNDIEGFRADILDPLERVLPKKAEKVWIIGNHERFEFDLIEEHPELDGAIDHVKLLQLVERGWEIIPLGHRKKLGELNVIHGEILTGIGNQAGMYPSRKAVELYSGNVVAGHTHSPQMFTKVSPVENKKKWQAHIMPIAGATNPGYLRNRPTAWLNGLGIVELHSNGFFNFYPVIVLDGVFSYGGRMYEAA